MRVYLYSQKWDKFWSISWGHFIIKHKPINNQGVLALQHNNLQLPFLTLITKHGTLNEYMQCVWMSKTYTHVLISVDDRTELKIPKFRCFGNFGSVRFGSVRLEKTEPKQIAEFRFKKYTVGKKIEKKSSSKSFSLSLLWVFLCEIEQKWLFIINFAKNGWEFPKSNVF